MVPPYWIVFRNIDITKSPLSMYSPVSISLRAIYVSSLLFLWYPYCRISMLIAPSMNIKNWITILNLMGISHSLSIYISSIEKLTAWYSYDWIITIFSSIVDSSFFFTSWIISSTYSAPIWKIFNSIKPIIAANSDKVLWNIYLPSFIPDPRTWSQPAATHCPATQASNVSAPHWVPSTTEAPRR